jgi:hypothetical protein
MDRIIDALDEDLANRAASLAVRLNDTGDPIQIGAREIKGLPFHVRGNVDPLARDATGDGLRRVHNESYAVQQLVPSTQPTLDVVNGCRLNRRVFLIDP